VLGIGFTPLIFYSFHLEVYTFSLLVLFFPHTFFILKSAPCTIYSPHIPLPTLFPTHTFNSSHSLLHTPFTPLTFYASQLLLITPFAHHNLYSAHLFLTTLITHHTFIPSHLLHYIFNASHHLLRLALTAFKFHVYCVLLSST